MSLSSRTRERLDGRLDRVRLEAVLGGGGERLEGERLYLWIRVPWGGRGLGPGTVGAWDSRAGDGAAVSGYGMVRQCWAMAWCGSVGL